MASGPITSWEIDGETVEIVSDFIFWGSIITADGDCSHEIKRPLFTPWKESYVQPREHIQKQRHYLANKHPSRQFSSVQLLSHVWLFATPWITAHQASITISWSSLGLMPIESVMPSSHLILCRPLLLLPPIHPSLSLFQWVSSSHEVAKVLEFQLQHHFFQRTPRADLLQNGLVGSPCSLRDPQESSNTTVKSINSSALSFLHSPTLTSIHDHWKNHSLD